MVGWLRDLQECFRWWPMWERVAVGSAEGGSGPISREEEAARTATSCCDELTGEECRARDGKGEVVEACLLPLPTSALLHKGEIAAGFLPSALRG